ncbi:MAG TPA: EamA family transporter [Actinomycetota bacterium]|nr:EamA family transporter [Actinomycetota bacterium]
MSDRQVGVALVLAAALSVQFGAAYAVTLFDELGPGGTAFARLALAAVILVVIWRPALGGRSRGDLLTAGLFGLALGLMNWTFYESIKRIPLGPAVTIEFLGPLGVAVAGSRRALDAVWVSLAGAGVLALTRPWENGGDLDALGMGFALAAGACWAAYIVLSARTGRVFPGGSGLAIAMVVGALVTLPTGVMQGGSDLLAVRLIGAVAIVALASSLIPYSLELEALRRIPSNVFGILLSLDPALAALAGFVVLDQSLAPLDVASIAAVVVASVGATATSRAPLASEPP